MLGRAGHIRATPHSILTKRPKPPKLNHMSVSRRIKSLFKGFKENPYPDGQISFKSLLYDIYKEPVSMTEDERPYSNGLVRFLEREADLIERYDKYERTTRDEDDGPFYYGGYTLYLYKDNLIPVKQGDEGVVTIDSYYPTSRKCVIDGFKRYLIKETGSSKVSVLVSRAGGLAINRITFPPPEIPDVELNYGTGFKKVYDKLVATLEQKKGGLVLMHGSAGSGKSYLMKHLTSVIDREFVFVGAAMIPRLNDPELVSLLLSKRGAVLVLEDAEQAIQKRDGMGDGSTTSVILNLTDGFMSSVLGCTVVASYNTETSQLDPALLRRGRLLFKHSFGPLNQSDAKRLVNKLGKTVDVKGPMTLADIYCAGEEAEAEVSTPEPSRSMGFHTLMSVPTPNAASVKEKVRADEKS